MGLCISAPIKTTTDPIKPAQPPSLLIPSEPTDPPRSKAPPMTEDTGYYIHLDYVPADLDKLVTAFGGILEREEPTSVIVYFKQSSKKAGDFIKALKGAHEYYNPTTPIPEGSVRCSVCKTIVKPDTCLHVYDKGTKSYECLATTECRKRMPKPPFINLVEKENPNGLPPFAELTHLELDEKVYHDDYYLHEASNSIYKRQNCRCACNGKWSKLTDEEAGRIWWELECAEALRKFEKMTAEEQAHIRANIKRVLEGDNLETDTATRAYHQMTPQERAYVRIISQESTAPTPPPPTSAAS